MITVNWKKFLLGVGIGFASAYLVKSSLSDEKISAEKALKLVKTSFKQQGPIQGSWIHMVVEDYHKNHTTYSVYKGGITRLLDNQLQQFEFIVDATTGTILDVTQV